MTERVKFPTAKGDWVTRVEAVNALIDDLARPTTEVARVVEAVAEGDLTQKMALKIEGQPVKGEFLTDRYGRELDARPALELRVRGYASRTRGGHGRQARRAGSGQGRLGDVEGPHRFGELHGLEPDGAGARHRAGDDRGREGRPDPEDHRRCEGRDPRAEEHDQRDGRPAFELRGRGDPSRPRGGNGREARRSGRGQGRIGDVEGPDRQRQLPRVEPDEPGAEHRPGHDRGRERRPVSQDHGRSQGRGRCSRRDDQRDGRSALDVRRRGDEGRPRGGHGRKARRPGTGEGRLGYVERPDRQRELHGREPHDPGAQHRERHYGGRDRGPVQEDHGRGQGRGCGPRRHDQHDGRPALRASRTR